MNSNGMRFSFYFQNWKIPSNPSIVGDTSFQSCKSSKAIFCQEISNERKSHVMDNITEQLHYETWREIEKIYKNSTKQFYERKPVGRDEL